MKKYSPSYKQNGQLVHWWVLIHSGHKPMCPQSMPMTLVSVEIGDEYMWK
jgi:hypothetical protein